ncbi:insulinase family protein [Streptomyces sp. MST-110588]|uniref:M16 family metallopeptidase n=1 Tax=Streptomyces sp. MST-110588 TaxID=2833628 RepID=UPI001F5D1CF3|nr:insulinase family protein [Streptomyces sp. MST-110588]UNO41783.1 insulinase family protein [Streptomyces sp. MST-110588]
MNSLTTARHLLDTTLPNGLRLIVVPDHSVPLVEIRLSIPFAGVGEAHAAHAHILGAVLLRPAAEVCSTRREAWATADINAARGIDRLGIFGYTPTVFLEPVLHEIAACLARPRYGDDAIAEARQKHTAHVGIGRAEARWMALAALLRRWYPAYAQPCDLPPPAALARVEPEKIRHLHHSRLNPAGATLVLVGDVEAAQLADLVRLAFMDWSGGPPPHDVFPPPSIPSAAGELTLLHRPKSAQAEVLMFGTMPERTDDRSPAFDIANVVFGDGVGSRLTRKVREDRGYAYLAGSAMEIIAGRSTLLIRLAVNERDAAAAVNETRAELAAMVHTPPDPAEIAAAKQLLAGRLVTSTASPASYATSLVNVVAEGAPPDWDRAYARRLAGTGRTEVAEAALAHFSPEVLDTVVVGDAEALAVPLEQVADLRVLRYERLEDVPALPRSAAFKTSPREAR